jgi:hypothetical protein
MSRFEWMELDNVSREIAHAQSRLDAARATKNHGLTRLLEGKIAEKAELRVRILGDITKGLAAAKPNLSSASAPKLVPEQAQETPQNSKPAETIIANAPPSPKLMPNPDPTEGVAAVWDELKRADIEGFKRVLESRRSEMLARHAEELKALDAEQNEIDIVACAIEVFVQKFKIGGGGQVVQFDAERHAQTQAG